MTTKWDVAEYVTHPSGTVHMVNQADATIASTITDEPPRTLCGLVVGWERDGWAWGDETVSGIRATCRRCRKAML